MLPNGAEQVINASELKKGDLVLVKAGELIPNDGEVIEGIASVDESAITGESAPVTREAGGDFSSVTGGTTVVSDWLKIKIVAEPGKSFLDKMISMVEGASRQKTPNEIALNGGVSSGSYNYGNSNPELEKRIQKDLDEFLEEHPGLKAEEVPSDLLTASGSGLDPHISPKAAEIQIPYVAENAGLSEEEVKEIVDENTEHKVFGIFGEERVNVLKCNLAIANAMGILE